MDSPGSPPVVSGQLLSKALKIEKYRVRFPAWARMEFFEEKKTKEEVLADAEARGAAEALPKKQGPTLVSARGGIRPLSLQSLAGHEIVSHCDTRSLQRYDLKYITYLNQKTITHQYSKKLLKHSSYSFRTFRSPFLWPSANSGQFGLYLFFCGCNFLRVLFFSKAFVISFYL